MFKKCIVFKLIEYKYIKNKVKQKLNYICLFNICFNMRYETKKNSPILFIYYKLSL